MTPKPPVWLVRATRGFHGKPSNLPKESPSARRGALKFRRRRLRKPRGTSRQPLCATIGDRISRRPRYCSAKVSRPRKISEKKGEGKGILHAPKPIRSRHIHPPLDIQITRTGNILLSLPSLHSFAVSLQRCGQAASLSPRARRAALSPLLRLSASLRRTTAPGENKAYPYSQSVNRLPPVYTAHIANQALLCKYGKGC